MSAGRCGRGIYRRKSMSYSLWSIPQRSEGYISNVKVIGSNPIAPSNKNI